MGKFQGKVVIITGAASGMGEAQSRRFIEEGAYVVLCDIDKNGEAKAKELGDRAIFVQHDVSKEENWASVTTTASRKYGRIDVLVNTAGVALLKTIEDTTAADIERQYAVNQLGTMLGIMAVAPHMASGGGGAIVNISSGAGMRASPVGIGYSASKWAVRGITKCAAAELASKNIRVNTICPGPIDTPMLSKNSKEFNDRLVAMTPLRRLGTALEIAEATLFLASDAASYITGVDLPVDGGRTM